MQILSFLVPLFLIYSCNSTEVKGTSNKHDIEPVFVQSLISDTLVVLDTLNKVIQWKFQGMDKSMKDTIEFPLPNLDNHTVEWKNLQFISLRMSCGSPCWSSYIFPMNERHSKIRRYIYSMAFDTNRNLVVYQPSDLDDRYMFRLENYENSKGVNISREICPASMTFLCIDKIEFTSTNIKVSWKKDFFESINKEIDSDLNIPIPPEILTN
jgi:hypothetical protein